MQLGHLTPISIEGVKMGMLFMVGLDRSGNVIDGAWASFIAYSCRMCAAKDMGA